MPARPILFAGWLVAMILINVRGDDEAPKVADVVNQVEGQTFIISIRTEGSKVKKGDVVCELDSAALRDRLTLQEITVIQAKAVFEAAKQALDVAETSAQESEAGMAQEIMTAENEVRLWELDIKFTKEKIETAKAKQKTQGERGDFDKAVADLARFEANLNKAQAKVKTLKGITQQKRKIEADLAVSKAKTDLKSSEAIYGLEKAKFDKIGKMIESCVMKAPIDGRVQYNNPKVPRADGYKIEEGATVRLRQVILRVLAE